MTLAESIQRKGDGVTEKDGGVNIANSTINVTM
jgi:hypothetical protein